MKLSFSQLEALLNSTTDIFSFSTSTRPGSFKLNLTQFRIMKKVAAEGQMKMKDVGEYFNIKLSTLTSTIDKLEEKGFVKRTNSKEDRRVVYLKLTPKGKKLLPTAYEYLQLLMSAGDFELETEE